MTRKCLIYFVLIQCYLFVRKLAVYLFIQGRHMIDSKFRVKTKENMQNKLKYKTLSYI